MANSKGNVHTDVMIYIVIGIYSSRSVVGMESLRHLLTDLSDASQRPVTGRLNQIFSSLSSPRGLNIFVVCNKRPLRFSFR